MDTTTQAVRRALAGLCVVASLTAVACSSGSGSTTTAATSPVRQEIPEGQFSAEFPSAPVREEERVSASGLDLVIVTYGVETGKESIVVGYTDYPKNVVLSKVLDGAADGSASQVNGTLQSKTPTTFMGHPAMDVVVKVDGGMVYERLVLRGNRLFTLIGAGGSGRPPAYDRLIETFYLI